MQLESLNYLKEVLGVKHIPKPESVAGVKITLLAYFDCEDVVQVRYFEKLKNLLEGYGVLGSVLINPTDLNKDSHETGIRQKKPTSRLVFASLTSLGSPYSLILSLGRPSLNDTKLDGLHGIWKKVGSQMIMWTHPVSEFEDKKIKSVVWRDVKRAIRMCGVSV